MIWLFKCISGVRSSALASGGAFPLTSFDGNTSLLFANTSAGNSAPSLVTTPFFLNPSSFSLLPANLLSAGGALNLQLTSDVATTTKSVGVASTAKWGSAYSCATTKNTSRKLSDTFLKPTSKLTKNVILDEAFYSWLCGTRFPISNQNISDLLRCVGRSVGGLFNRVLLTRRHFINPVRRL